MNRPVSGSVERQPLQLAGALFQQTIRFFEGAGPIHDAHFQLAVQQPQLFEKIVAIALEEALLGGVAEDLQQLLGPPGLEQVMVNLSAVDGIDGIRQLSVARHEQADRTRMVLTDPFQKLNARLARHLLVGQNQIDRLGSEGGLRGLDAVRRDDIELRRQKGREGRKKVRFVIDQQ